ncbi:MAG: hypothetical protein RLZZ517_591 [Candidatus Parcubacteria bacterium]|jgi:hypothetical protein
MAKRVTEHIFTGTTTPYTSYDSTKTVLGDLMEQYTGAGATDKFAGPLKVGVARPMEMNVAIPGISPHIIRWANKSGFYSTGTVGVSGTTVTGSGTAWLTDGAPIGARIGFGSTNPSEITTWYTITSIPSNTSITIEFTTTISAGTSFVIDKNYQLDWVFLTDNATAAATRRTSLFTYNRNSSIFNWKGAIIHTFPAATNHTVRGFRVSYQKYTTGTVGVSTATVTGSGTAWSTSRIFIGARIGFGSSDPTQISQWYYINAISSDTSLTIQTNVTASGTGGVAANITVTAGTAYVIEELRILHSTTNATATNGGLFMTGCVSYDDFINTTGTTIAAATTVDKAKAVYWLADASTVLNTSACGLAIEEIDSWTQQYVYVLDTATVKVYKYNFRAALTLTAGKSTNAFVLATGNQAVTGTISQVNNGRIGILTHGPGNGVESLYFVTTTRIYRAALSNITSGSTTWQSDSMIEVPTGGTSTYAAAGIMSSVEIADQIDRLIITTTGNGRSYVTQYKTDGSPFDHVFLADTRQIDQGIADANSVPHINQQGAQLTVWSEGGLVYIARSGTTAATNQIYAVPLGADWAYADGTVKQRIITPSLNTTGATKFTRVYVSNQSYLGGGGITIPTEPYRIYYRTAGISDNSGTFNLVDPTGDLTGVDGADSIQFAIEFRMIGTMCLPNRIYNLACVYEDNTTDSHYQPSVAQSSITNKRFAWRFSTLWGGTVPSLTIRLYDAVTGGLLLTDNTASPTAGTWEKSTNGGSSWSSYDTNDKTNETTYIRYTPSSLGDDIKVRALLTQS